MEKSIREKMAENPELFDGVKTLEIDSNVLIPIDESEGFDNICRFFNYKDYVLVKSSG